MTLKSIFLSAVCALLLASCNTPISTSDKQDPDDTILIITNSIPMTIHTKMIVGNVAKVVLNESLGVKKLTGEQQKDIDAADIIITQDLSPDFALNTVSQVFHGTHLRMIDNSHKQIIIPLSETLTNIKTLRDTLAEIDPSHRGTYFDKAGNYENLLQETYKKLRNRIDEYNKKPFLIFGDHMGVFLEEFGLSQYITATFSQSIEPEQKETLLKKIQTLIDQRNITIAFIENNTDRDINDLLIKNNITLYRMKDVEDDTSAWGYIRFIEKTVDLYVNAFNAYD